MLDFLLRFCIGGLAVSGFAVLSDIFRPKSFAGLFGAAPSIALSTLVIALYQHGSGYMAVEGRSMVLGSIALFFYCIAACRLMQRHNVRAFWATASALLVWAAVAFGGGWVLHRGVA
ncbi:MAG TPA: DUF3147 family protein [Rhizomicrobium sp.]|nr:DUF3147 family protein [Rhizomicrobium sp.]